MRPRKYTVENLSNGIRKNLMEFYAPIEKKITLFLSSGIDSQALFYCLVHLKKDFQVCSFTLDNRESRDFRYARYLANTYGIEFLPIKLSTNLENLIADIRYQIDNLQQSGKAEIECVWPFVKSIPKCSGEIISTGYGSDAMYCLSKTGEMHFKDKMVQYRNEKIKSGITQESVLIKICAKHKKVLLLPYRHLGYQSLYTKYVSWDQLNKPVQKFPLKHAFHEYTNGRKLYNHQNLQLGDSGISDLFSELVDHPININRRKSTVGIFNDIRNKRI